MVKTTNQYTWSRPPSLHPPPPNGLDPQVAPPFLSICKLLAAFLRSSFVFARSLQHFWLPASHLLGTCYLLGVPNRLPYHTYHPYNTNHSCHTYHTYHTYQTYHTTPPPHHRGMCDSDCAVFTEVASQSEEWHRQLGGHLECNRWDALRRADMWWKFQEMTKGMIFWGIPQKC